VRVDQFLATHKPAELRVLLNTELHCQGEQGRMPSAPAPADHQRWAAVL
jgi:hypothetical protein